MMEGQNDGKTQWLNEAIMWWWIDGMMEWHDLKIEWCYYEMIYQRNDGTMKQWNDDRMAE